MTSPSGSDIGTPIELSRIGVGLVGGAARTVRPRAMLLALMVAIVALLGPGLAVAGPSTELAPESQAWLEERGALRVGWSAVLRPVSIVEDGIVTGGYAVEAWDLAALRLGIDLEHVDYPDAAALAAALDSGEIDVVGALGSNAAMAEGLNESEPYAWVPGIFVGRPDQAATGLGDMAGRTFSSLPGAAVLVDVEREYPLGTYVETQGPVLGLQAVAAGEIDLYFGPLALLGHQISRLDLELLPIGERVGLSTVHSWTVAGTPAAEIADRVRSTLSDEDLAVLHVLSTGFDLTEPQSESSVSSGALRLVAGLALAVAFLVLLVVASRRQVAGATRGLRVLNENLEETVRVRTEALATSNQALNRFAVSAAHDLKGPVAGIASLVEMMVDDGVPDDLADDIELIGATAARLSTMVDTMLEEAVRVGTPADFIDGSGFEAWLRAVTSPELSLIVGELRIDVPDGLLDLDAEILRRTALNLVSNSIKYARSDSRSIIEVELRRSGDEWCLVVADNGGGIDRSRWSEIFEFGSRLVRDDRGFGLGLSTISDLIRDAGGTIDVGDADLGGAAFTVTLPRVQQAYAGVERGQQSASRLASVADPLPH